MDTQSNGTQQISTIGKWNHIPNELLELILSKLKSEEKDLCHYSLVNHQWFSICQPILYKEIFILNFTRDNKLINTLFSSEYESGKYVKQITLAKSLEAPADISSLQYLDPTEDVLHLLMKHCPHVKFLDFDEPCKESRDMEYFFIALNNMNTWRFTQLSHPVFFTDLSQYHRLAYMMESSLENLVVEKWPEEKDFTYLKRYTQLKTLRIEFKEKPVTISDCVQLLENAPNIENLFLDYDSIGDSEDTATTTTTTDMIVVEPSVVEHFTKVKTLKIRCFNPTSNDINFIISKFTNVSDLFLFTSINWFENAAPEIISAILDFLKYVTEIKKRRVMMDIRTNSRRIMDIFKDYYQVDGIETFKISPS